MGRKRRVQTVVVRESLFGGIGILDVEGAVKHAAAYIVGFRTIRRIERVLLYGTSVVNLCSAHDDGHIRIDEPFTARVDGGDVETWFVDVDKTITVRRMPRTRIA